MAQEKASKGAKATKMNIPPTPSSGVQEERTQISIDQAAADEVSGNPFEGPPWLVATPLRPPSINHTIPFRAIILKFNIPKRGH